MDLTEDRLKHSLAVARRMRVVAVEEQEDAFVLGLQILAASFPEGKRITRV